ncbi:unnamed protein product [Nezara viridula]|uniref:STK11-interacting protein C-terminal PH domain-containing protein n=1 Tax=Nezara viridula TaxID=85310 RepID=A0A9P0MR94_NEZVI|nr:unnamed protein product [Nezara viridula]
MQDEIDEVLRLIAQPIKCRNKLISGENKFVLNSSLLYKLNKILDIVENDSVDIILTESQRKALELFLRIINIIPKLEVSQRSAESFDSVIDLRKFKRLRYLELIRVCLDNTIGIDKLKTQLETFICNRSTKYLDVIFKQKKLQWAELKCLNLRHSQLSEISQDFFRHMPWIQNLDLSYNKLTSIDGLHSLDHLQCLNISFNNLERCPSLSKEVENKLEVLILSNNHITTLSGFQTLTSLKTLDLSSNWISKKSELLFLTSLKNLACFNIYENPISSLKYHRIYVSASLAKTVNSDKFLLDHQQLSSREKSLIGEKWCSDSQSCGINPNRSSSTLNTLITDETPPEPKKVNKGQRSNKKLSKPREVVILDISEGLQRETKPITTKETDFKPIETNVSEDNLITTSDKEDALMKQLSEINIVIDDPQLNVNLMDKNEVFETVQENNSETSKILISATIHAHDVIEETDPTIEGEDTVIVTSSGKSNELLETKLEENHENITERITEPEESFEKSTILDNETESSNDNYSDSNAPLIHNENENSNTAYQSSDSLSEDSNGFSDTEDEVLWQVQRKDNVTGAFHNIILVLLDDELKERSTSNHHVIAHWPLSSVQSCTKTKSDPVIVEIEFDTLKKDKRSRTYIMEYADAQVLLKKMYSILETRPLSDMNQRTYKCIKCTALFVHDIPIPSAFRAKGSLISCTVCSSTLVVEVEEPRLPEPKITPLPVVSHSSSQSSIGSAASLEPSRYERKFSNQKYESDIEVISNPSQSSIEVLDEHSRSTTPRRKISFEEKQNLNTSALPQLATVIEINSQFANLTESSSSGSLTESVITAYEALNINRKRFSDEEVLTEEESSPDSEPHPPDTIEEVIPTSIWKNESDVYSYVDFMDVDARVKLYLYQMLFEDDNEGLLMIARCHLWKTGGSDYDGCVVISNLKIYFLSHSRTNFKEDTCDWLSKFDCYNLKDVKEIAPLLWQQGARIQIKHICYLALLMDKNRNQNFFKHLIGLSLEGIKIQNNWNNSSELALQQSILSSNSIDKSLDPTVNYFTICLSISILKDDVEDEILRLGALVLTSGEFHLIPGELSWLAVPSVPSVVSSQEMSSLIEVERRQQLVNLHFLDEKAALEEVWSLKCTCDSQVSSIIDAIRSPWEQLFSVNLDVKNIS